MPSPMGHGPNRPGPQPTPIYPGVKRPASGAIPQRILDSFYFQLPKSDLQFMKHEQTTVWTAGTGFGAEIASIAVPKDRALVVVDFSFYALERIGATDDVQLVGAASLLGQVMFRFLVDGQSPYPSTCIAYPCLAEGGAVTKTDQHGIMQMSAASGVVGFAVYARGPSVVSARYQNVYAPPAAGTRADGQLIAVRVGVVIQGFYVPTVHLDEILGAK